MAQNPKDLRIKKLIERGITEPRTIARKIGYTGNATQAGIARVHDACKRLGITLEKHTQHEQSTMLPPLVDNPSVAI